MTNESRFERLLEDIMASGSVTAVYMFKDAPLEMDPDFYLKSAADSIRDQTNARGEIRFKDDDSYFVDGLWQGTVGYVQVKDADNLPNEIKVNGKRGKLYSVSDGDARVNVHGRYVERERAAATELGDAFDALEREGAAGINVYDKACLVTGYPLSFGPRERITVTVADHLSTGTTTIDTALEGVFGGGGALTDTETIEVAGITGSVGPTRRYAALQKDGSITSRSGRVRVPKQEPGYVQPVKA